MAKIWTDSLLKKYTNDNGIIFDKEYKNVKGKTKLDGKCNTKGCKGTFSKSFETMVKESGPFCRECVIKNAKIKREKVSHTFDRRRLEQYEKDYDVVLSTTDQLVNRDSVITGDCKSCQGPFSKRFRYLIENGGAYCKPCSEINRQAKCIVTNQKNRGVDNPAQAKDVQESMAKTNLERYGVENPNQCDEIKEKAIITNLERYGVEYPLQCDEIKDKIKETNLERYGFEYATQSEEVKEKTRETCLKKYGFEFATQHPDTKRKVIETNRIKYGVDNIMHNEEIYKRHLMACYKTKDYKLPSGKIIQIQGYENFGLDYIFKTYNPKESNIITQRDKVPEILWFDENGKQHRHYVDIFYLSRNTCIEIKSTWTIKLDTENIFLKQKYAKEAGYRYQIWVYDQKGECDECFT